MTDSAYDWRALPAGARVSLSVPGLVMAASFIGFGALVRGLEIGLLPGLLSTVFVWALPGQVVLVNMYAEGAAFLAVAAAVTLTAVRLLPMVVLVISTVRLEGAPRWPLYFLAHFIAVTIWRIAEDGLEERRRAQRLPWLLGVGLTLMVGMLAMTCAGYYLAQSLPPLLAACLIFLTPSFFFISLFASARLAMDYVAIAAGALIGPAVYHFYPDFDLLVGGLAGGTIAYGVSRLRKSGR
jgi:predicted branched-subunit amino acid permease